VRSGNPLLPPLSCRGILFDLDGVLVDSRGCIRNVWEHWAAQRGIDAAPFERVAHGRRTSETLKLVAPHLDIEAETAALDRLEEEETRGLEEVPGARELLRKLPPERWGIVTSGSPAAATLRLRFAHLPLPKIFVTGSDVLRGKPDPEGYLAGARRLGGGAAPSECVAVEDAPPGVAAAKAAGLTVIAVLSTHAAPDLAGADVVLRRLADLVTEIDREGLTLRWPH